MNWNSIKLALPLLLLAAVACRKEVPASPVNEGGDAVLTVRLPGAVTKTQLGAKQEGKYPTLWQEGDCLQLNGYSSLPLGSADAGKNSAPFIFRDGLSSPFNFLYPVTGEADLVVFPATQYYASGSFDPQAVPMWATSETYTNVDLHHFSSLVRISITSQTSRVLSSVTLIALGGEPLSGSFRAGTDGKGAFDGSLTAEEGEAEVVLSFGSEGLPVAAGETVPVYIAVPQGEYASGFKAVVKTAAYEYRLLNFFSKGRSLEPGKVLEFPDKDFDDLHVVWEYYVSATGTGEGFSEEDPMSVDAMVALLSNPENAARLDEATFHFTAGTHLIGAPIVLPGKDIYQQDVTYTITGDKQAILDGGGVSQIFLVSQDNSHVTVKDLVLTHGSSSESGGLVSVQHSGPLFEKCSFTNTQCNNTGGAVRVSGADAGKAYFQDCGFSGVSGTNGGMVVITNAGTEGYFTRCTFSGGTASSGGGVFYITNGTTTLDHCTLDGNKAKDGGAISATNGTVLLNDCTFSYNTATGNAGAIYTADKQKAVYYINGCTFLDNTALTNGYAIYLNTQTAGNVAHLCVNNSTFYNTQDMTGSNASLVCNKGKSLILNSTFYGKTSRWGTFALGCHKNHGDQHGCLLLNSIFVNTTSGKPSIYQTGGNYWAEAKNCISSLNAENTQFTVTDCISTMPSLVWDGTLFTWNGETHLKQLSEADIRAILSDEDYQLGAAFLVWLDQIDALGVDQRGVFRTGYIWAGSYQN